MVAAVWRCQVARGRAIIPANKRHVELEPTIIGERRTCATSILHMHAWLALFVSPRKRAEQALRA